MRTPIPQFVFFSGTNPPGAPAERRSTGAGPGIAATDVDIGDFGDFRVKPATTKNGLMASMRTPKFEFVFFSATNPPGAPAERRRTGAGPGIAATDVDMRDFDGFSW
jgi:hypothetical protein